MTAYRWMKEDKPKNAWHYLVPVGQQNACAINAIATISVRAERYPKRRLVVRAGYRWNGTGNDTEGWMESSSVVKAKRWAESQLAGFWEPPTVTP